MLTQNQRIAHHFYTVVVPAYEAYKIKRNSTDNDNHIPAAKTAAIEIYHFDDLIRADHKETKERGEKYPDFKTLGFAVNALKHHKKARESTVAGSESIKEIIITIIFHDEEGDFEHDNKEVLLFLTDGSRRNLFELMTNVLNMWAEYLYKENIIRKEHYFEGPSIGPVSRTLAKKTNPATMQFDQDYVTTVLYNKLRYNYTTKTYEDIPNEDSYITNVRMHSDGDMVYFDFAINTEQEQKITIVPTMYRASNSNDTYNESNTD